MPDLSILRLDFRLRAEASVVLPPFLGSTLRGAFGRALKQIFCFVPHGECDRCWFRQACAYQYIFESKNLGTIPVAELHTFLKGQKEFPHPFVLIPPAPVSKSRPFPPEQTERVKNFNEDYQSNHFCAGDTLDFSLLLIGKAAQSWAQVVVAVRLLAERGLGEEATRVPFSLILAMAHDAGGRSLEIFSRENPHVSTHNVSAVKLEQVVNLEIEILKRSRQTSEESSLHVEFITPASRRILLEGSANGKLDFTDLLKKITRRLELLAFLHGEPSQKIDYRPVLAGAENVRVADQILNLYHYEQHSERQERKVRRDVFLGKVSYRGNGLEKFLPFLKAGEILNVGADTTHGLGRFALGNDD